VFSMAIKITLNKAALDRLADLFKQMGEAADAVGKAADTVKQATERAQSANSAIRSGLVRSALGAHIPPLTRASTCTRCGGEPIGLFLHSADDVWPIAKLKAPVCAQPIPYCRLICR
jgi:hypothetical protein